MFKNILKAFTVLALSAAAASAASVSLDYTKDGVLRADDQCKINFVNFGVGNDIKNLTVKKENEMSGKFNLKIEGLKSGNEGLNNKVTGYTFDSKELPKYIKVSQNGAAKDYSVVAAADGKFSILIKDLRSCEGITVKQTFKTAVEMNSYLYYSNVKPDGINHAFDIVEFGPSSNNVPYDTLLWDMNKGLDAAREQCRIYIDFHESDWTGGFHWKWYLSTDNINGENCDNHEFYKAVKPAYQNYDVMEELFGDHYDGYVIKREGSGIGHMDGILVNQKYIIEIYQNGCDEQNKDQVICTITSNKKLSYSEFTKEFVANCGAVIDDEKEVPTWSVDAKGVTAKFDSYSLNIVNYNRGALPKSASESVTYKEFKAANSSGIARFSVSTACGNGTYIGDKCKCISCPENCTTCLGPDQCTVCNEETVLENGQCVKCPKGSIIENGKCKECPKGTETDDGKVCRKIECPKGKELNLDNGKCEDIVCPKGKELNLDNGKCEDIVCPKGKELNLDNGKCEDIICPKGKELNLDNGKCEDIICPKGKELNLDNGKCEDIVCPKGKELNLDNGKCEDIVCPKGKELNLENGKCEDIVCPKGEEFCLEELKCKPIVCPKGKELNLEDGKCHEVPVTEVEEVGDVTEKEEATESDNDSDEEEVVITDAPTEVDDDAESDVEEVSAETEEDDVVEEVDSEATAVADDDEAEATNDEAEATAEADDVESNVEEEKQPFVEETPKEKPKKANVTRVVTLKKPKRITKCIVKKH